MADRQPNSRGRYSRGNPFSAGTESLSAARSGTGGRLPFGLGRSNSKSGLIRSQSALGSKGLAAMSSLTALLVDQIILRVLQPCISQEIPVLLGLNRVSEEAVARAGAGER